MVLLSLGMYGWGESLLALVVMRLVYTLLFVLTVRYHR